MEVWKVRLNKHTGNVNERIEMKIHSIKWITQKLDFFRDLLTFFADINLPISDPIKCIAREI